MKSLSKGLMGVVEGSSILAHKMFFVKGPLQYLNLPDINPQPTL